MNIYKKYIYKIKVYVKKNFEYQSIAYINFKRYITLLNVIILYINLIYFLNS